MLKDVQSAIIAGGKSRRFGSPKQSACLQRETLLGYAYRLASAISPDVMLVGEAHLTDDFPIKGIPDIVTGCGPVCGIYTALVHAKKNWVAVLPVDMPLLSVDVYRFLYPSCSADIPVIACSHKGLEPLVSIWPSHLAAHFKKAIDNHAYKLRDLIQKEGALIVDLPEVMHGYRQEWFTNINYKQDLIELEKDYKKLYIAPKQ